MHNLSFLTVVCCAIVMSACHSPERSGTCVAISGATRAVVRSSSRESPRSEYAIMDQVRVRDLIVFANERREVSRPSLSTMPAPEVTAVFYNGNDSVGAIGAGSNFFFVSCSNWKGVREATAAEIAEFKRLIGSADEKGAQK
jgi:hypothetical protein